MVQLYLNWNEFVRRTTPPERLLEFNVKQGIEPLAKFLERDLPPGSTMPFINNTREFDHLTQLLKFTALCQISGIVGISYSVFHRIRFQKMPLFRKTPILIPSLAAAFGPIGISLIVAKLANVNSLIPF